MKKIEFSDIELIALSKALGFIRFRSEDYEAREFAGSPHIAEVYKRITEATWDYYKQWNKHIKEWPEIESTKGYLNVIKTHISNVDNWHQLELAIRKSFIENLVYPYKISAETFSELLKFGDEVHSEKN